MESPSSDVSASLSKRAPPQAMKTSDPESNSPCPLSLQTGLSKVLAESEAKHSDTYNDSDCQSVSTRCGFEQSFHDVQDEGSAGSSSKQHRNCLKQVTQKYPKTVLGILCGLVVLLLALGILYSFSAVVAILVRKAIATTVIEVDNLHLKTPVGETIGIDLVGHIKRAFGPSVVILPFDLLVYHAPLETVGTRSGLLRVYNQSPLPGLSLRQLSADNDDTLKSLPDDGFVRRFEPAVFPDQLAWWSMSPETETVLLPMAHMHFDEITLKRKAQSLHQSSVLQIENKEALSQFMREYVQVRRSVCLVTGSLAVKVFGLTFPPVEFRQIYIAKGFEFKFHIPLDLVNREDQEATLDDRNVAEKHVLQAVNKNYPNNNFWPGSGNTYIPTLPKGDLGIYQEAWKKAAAQPVATGDVYLNSLEMSTAGGSSMAKTEDDNMIITKDIVGLRLMKLRADITLVLDNTQFTIDHLGVLGFALNYKGETLVIANTEDIVRLYSGPNSIPVIVEIEPFELMKAPQRQKLLELVGDIFRRQRIEVDLQGLGSTVEVYRAAIQAIHMTIPIGKEADTSQDLSYNDAQAAFADTETSSRNANEKADWLAQWFLTKLQLLQLNLQYLSTDAKAGLVVRAPTSLLSFRVQGVVLVGIKNPFQSAPFGFGPIYMNSNVSMLHPETSEYINLGAVKGSMHAMTADQKEAFLNTSDQVIVVESDAPSVTKPEASSTGRSSLIDKIAYTNETFLVVFDLQLDIWETKLQEVVKYFMVSITESLQFKLSAVNLGIQEIQTPLGSLADLDVVALDHLSFDFRPVNFIDNMKWVSFGIDKSANTQIWQSLRQRQGIRIYATVEVNSTSSLSVNLGTITVEIAYQGSHVAYMSAPSCQLHPGVNRFNFSGAIKLLEINNVPLVTTMVMMLLGNRPVVVDVQFMDPIDVPGFEESVSEPGTWFIQAVAGMHFPAVLNNDMSMILPQSLPPENSDTDVAHVEATASDTDNGMESSPPGNLFQKFVSEAMRTALYLMRPS